MSRIALVVKGYPRLSETFIAQGIRALEGRGLRLRLYSLRHPTDPAVHPVHREIAAPVVYLPEYLKDDPRRVWRSWRRARALPGYPAARRALTPRQRLSGCVSGAAVGVTAALLAAPLLLL